MAKTTLKGSTKPRIYTPPLRKLTDKTSLGFLFIDFCENMLHFRLLDWQKWASIHILEVDETGSFRFSHVVLEVPRQNGKTTFMKALSLFFFFVLKIPFQVVTAQTLDKANEIWEETIADIEHNEEMSALVKSTTRGNSGKVCTLLNGARFGAYASNRSAMRGKAIDLVLFDEIREQHDWDGWSAVSGTTTARPNALILCASNAGTAESVVLREFRKQALLSLGYQEEIGEEETEHYDIQSRAIGWFEWSAEPSLDAWDKRAWAQANPSLGYGFLTEATLATKFNTMPLNDFKTEHLCQWTLATVYPPFEKNAWELAEDNNSRIAQNSEMVFGVDLNEKRTHSSLAVCGLRPDRQYHVELIAQRTGIVWLFEWLRKQGTKKQIKVAVQARGCPIASYIKDLKDIKGVDVIECEGRDLGAWTGRFYDAVMANVDEIDSDAVAIKHLTQDVVDEPALTARKRSLGDGAWTWNRKESLHDVSPLMAETLAFGALSAGVTEKRVRYKSSYTNLNTAREGKGVLFV